MTNQRLTGYPSIDKPWLKYYPADAADYVTADEHQSIYQYLRNSCQQHPDYIAIEYFGHRITYQQLLECIDKTASSLVALGITEGDYVTVCLPNLPEIVFFIYALNSIGATACLIDPRTNSENILHRANESQSKLLIAVTDIIPAKIDPIADQLIAEKIIDVSPAYSAKSLAVKAAYSLKRRHYKSSKYISQKAFLKNQVPACHPRHSQSSAIMLYTSGTTGDSKGIMLSDENMIAAHKLIHFGATQTEHNAIFLGVIPFFSAYGAVTGMNNSLCSGWKIVMIPKYDPKDFGKLLLAHNAECVIGVPRFWEDFAASNKAVSLCHLINSVCGGDRIAPPALDRVNQYLSARGGSRLKVGYGASEFGGGIVITTDNGPYEEGGTGEILPGVIGMVIDPDTGEELTYNADGELCFHSPSMMLGYFNRESETEEITVYKNGIKFYRTGDKGHISPSGTVHIIDRYKRIVIRPDGHTVNVSPIENVILSHAGVLACAVVGIPLDSKAGVIPTAFIVTEKSEQDFETLIRKIDSLCLEKLPGRDKAQAYVQIDALPYTPMGKVDYRKLASNQFDKLTCIITDYTFLGQ